MTSALTSWAAVQTAGLGDSALARLLATLWFATGGVGFVAPFGLLLVGIAVPALVLKLLPRPLAWAGLAVGVLAMLSTFALFTGLLHPLLPVGRFGGVLFLIAVAAAPAVHPPQGGRRPAPATAFRGLGRAHPVGAVRRPVRVRHRHRTTRRPRRGRALRPALGNGAERLSMVGETVAHLRKLDARGDRQGQRTPVLIAAGGPRALALAAGEADIVTLAAPPLTPRAEVVRMSAGLRERAGDRDVEIAMNLFVVGTEVPPWTRRFLGVDPATLDERGSLAVLRGTPRQMADELVRRRDELGVTYFVSSASYGEALAPVVELLTR